MSVIDQVIQTITYALTSDLSEFIADHFGLDSNEVSTVVRDYLGHNSTPVSPIAVKAPLRKSPPTKPAASGVKRCIFIITRGDNGGKLCNTCIRGKGDYCSKHKTRKVAQKTSQSA